MMLLEMLPAPSRPEARCLLLRPRIKACAKAKQGIHLASGFQAVAHDPHGIDRRKLFLYLQMSERHCWLHEHMGKD